MTDPRSMPALRTTVIGSYPFPGWLEFASQHLDEFGPDDLAEMQQDAVIAAVHDQLAAGLDVITDGEQTRFDFNLSFYGYIEGIDRESAPPRRWGPPAHDQRGKHRVAGELRAPRGLGAVEEFRRLQRVAPKGPGAPVLKASVPGPVHAQRPAAHQCPIPRPVRADRGIGAAGCRRTAGAGRGRVRRDHRGRAVDELLRLPRRCPPVRRYLQPHGGAGGGPVPALHPPVLRQLQGRAVAPRRYAPMFPAFLDAAVDEIHLEMASREFAELEIVREIAAAGKVACVGVIDVKSYYIETPDDVAGAGAPGSAVCRRPASSPSRPIAA